MPLIPPALDDRSYDDLVQDMLASIPAHTPEWTNPQPGDPGRTLLELFAWLADTILYRANLIPEKQRIAFLRLLGQSMQPAAAATGILSLALDPASVTPVGLIAPAKITGAVPFETLGEINLLPVTAQAYIKVPLTSDQQAASMPLLAGLQKLYNLSTLPAGYTTTAVFANNLADLDGIDVVNGTTDQSLWLALLVAKPENLPLVLKSIGGQSGQQILNIGFVPSITVPGLFSDVGPPAAVQATWQMSQPPVQAGPARSPIPLLQGASAIPPSCPTQTGICITTVVPKGGTIGAPSNDVSVGFAGRRRHEAATHRRHLNCGPACSPARLVHLCQEFLRFSWLGVNAVQIDQRYHL